MFDNSTRNTKTKSHVNRIKMELLTLNDNSFFSCDDTEIIYNRSNCNLVLRFRTVIATFRELIVGKVSLSAVIAISIS